MHQGWETSQKQKKKTPSREPQRKNHKKKPKEKILEKSLVVDGRQKVGTIKEKCFFNKFVKLKKKNMLDDLGRFIWIWLQNWYSSRFLTISSISLICLNLVVKFHMFIWIFSGLIWCWICNYKIDILNWNDIDPSRFLTISSISLICLNLIKILIKCNYRFIKIKLIGRFTCLPLRGNGEWLYSYFYR